MTERELLYKIYTLIEENRDGQKSRPHLYWLIGAVLNQYAAQRPMQQDINGVLAHQLSTAIRGKVGFSARNLRYMRKFAQIMPHPDHWDAEIRARRWTDHLGQITHADQRGKAAQSTSSQSRPAPGRTMTRTAPAPAPDRTRLTDTHVVTLTSAVLSHIPSLSLIGLTRHAVKRDIFAAALHLLSVNGSDIMLIVHDSEFRPGDIERMYKAAVRTYPWRTIFCVQYNVDTKLHVHAPIENASTHQLVTRLLIEVRRVFLIARI